MNSRSPPEAPAAASFKRSPGPISALTMLSSAMLSPEQVGEFLAVIDPVTCSKYDDWLHLMMACHNASGGAAVEEFVAWAISDPDIQSLMRRRIARSGIRSNCEKPNGITVGTLFKAVCDAGQSTTGGGDAAGSPPRMTSPELPEEIPSDGSQRQTLPRNELR